MATKNNVVEIRWFSATWPGKCSSCGEPFEPNADIGYAPSPDTSIAPLNAAELVVGRNCCAGSGKILDGFEEEAPYAGQLNSLLPRGKTAKDACKKCFLIHSTAQTKCE